MYSPQCSGDTQTTEFEMETLGITSNSAVCLATVSHMFNTHDSWECVVHRCGLTSRHTPHDRKMQFRMSLRQVCALTCNESNTWKHIHLVIRKRALFMQKLGAMVHFVNINVVLHFTWKKICPNAPQISDNDRYCAAKVALGGACQEFFAPRW